MYYLTDEEKRTITQLPTSLEAAADALEADQDFLLAGDVFSAELIRNHLAKIRSDAAEVALVPHPLEYAKYYDL